MAASIAEHLLTGWYWRVRVPGPVSPADPLERHATAGDAPTLNEAMRLW